MPILFRFPDDSLTNDIRTLVILRSKESFVIS